MFAIKLGVRGLAHTRFAISPLQEICGLLELVARPELAVPAQRAALARTRSALGDGRLELIAGLAAPGYLPDMLTPHPDGDGDVTAELRPAHHRGALYGAGAVRRHARARAQAVRCTPNVLIDPCPGDRRPPVICYPIDAAFRPDEGVARPSADLLGSTGAKLLADLAVARTTTDLAARHHLTPSSVSYHLGVLHRAGLATRERVGARVLYRRTSRANTLLVAGAGG